MIGLAAATWRHKRLFFSIVFSVTAAAVVFSLVTEKEYTARASFMVPPNESGDISSFLSNPLSAVLGKRGSASLDRLVAFLNAERTQRILVREFGLMEYYEVERFADAMKGLESATNVVVSPEGVVSILLTDRDPEKAADIANRYVEIVDSLFTESETAHAGQIRRFMGERLRDNERDLTAAEDAMREFAEVHGVVSLPDQVSALVQEMAIVEGKIRALDVGIGTARQLYGPRHSTVQQLQVERRQYERQREQLMASRGGTSADGDPLLTFSEIPERAVEYARLKRDVETFSIIQQVLVQQFETARLDEARKVPALTTVDPAIPPELRSWPRRGRIVILSGIMAGVWGLLIVVLADNWSGLVRRFHDSVERGNDAR